MMETAGMQLVARGVDLIRYMALSVAFLVVCSSPVFGQAWPHEQANFSGGSTTKDSPASKHSQAPITPAAPNKTAWRGAEKGVPQRSQHQFDTSKGYLEIDARHLPVAREIVPAKPVIKQNVEQTEIKTTDSKPSKSSKPVEVADAPYRVQIGDRLTVAIYGEANTERQVLVDMAGTITYPIVGNLEVVGKTIDEVRKAMNDRIKKVYRYTFVTITPAEFGGEHYTILGSVSTPGQKLLLGNETVLSALCRAGGFPMGQYRNQTVDLADLEHAFLLRDGDYVPINFKKLVTEGDLSQNMPMKAGDYIYIPSSLEKEIFVMGEVATPSAIGYINQVTLMESIAMAGGITFNASSRVVVVRGSLSEPYTFYIDVNRIFKGCERDFLLKPGDIVYVPPRQFTNLREILQYAVRVFVSTAASDAGSAAWASITGSAPIENVNVIPNAAVSPVIFTPVIQP